MLVVRGREGAWQMEWTYEMRHHYDVALDRMEKAGL